MTPDQPPDQPPDQSPPDTVAVPVAALVTLAVEHWRLTEWLTGIGGDTAATAGPARHALRRIADLLARQKVEVRPLTGHPFDAGLAARVVDTTDDPSLPPGTAVVAETVSPLVLIDGRVARPADVVTRVGRGV